MAIFKPEKRSKGMGNTIVFSNLYVDSSKGNAQCFLEVVHKWVYGGQKKIFFQEHRCQINTHNLKMLNLLSLLLCVAAGVFYVFNLNCDNMPELRIACLVFFLLFFCLFILDRLQVVTCFIGDSSHVFIVYEFIFAFLLLVGPVFDSGRLACFIPVFFATAPILTIIPMHLAGVMMTFNLVSFSFVTICCKGPQLGMYDVINGIACMVIGFALGQRVLKERISSLAAYDLLSFMNESELARVTALANTDPLTNVKNRVAYEAKTEYINKMIRNGVSQEFAIVVCDVNGLKFTNDNYGHSNGDILIQNSCREICHVFSHSPVFRIGGDEFVIILMGEDYNSRSSLLETLKDRSIGNPPMASFSFGASDYKKGLDNSVKDVFVRADAQMYKDKKQRKPARD